MKIFQISIFASCKQNYSESRVTRCRIIWSSKFNAYKNHCFFFFALSRPKESFHCSYFCMITNGLTTPYGDQTKSEKKILKKNPTKYLPMVIKICFKKFPPCETLIFSINHKWAFMEKEQHKTSCNYLLRVLKARHVLLL